MIKHVRDFRIEKWITEKSTDVVFFFRFYWSNSPTESSPHTGAHGHWALQHIPGGVTDMNPCSPKKDDVEVMLVLQFWRIHKKCCIVNVHFFLKQAFKTRDVLFFCFPLFRDSTRLRGVTLAEPTTAGISLPLTTLPQRPQACETRSDWVLEFGLIMTDSWYFLILMICDIIKCRILYWILWHFNDLIYEQWSS